MRYVALIMTLALGMGCEPSGSSTSESSSRAPGESPDGSSPPAVASAPTDVAVALQGEWVVVSSTGVPDRGHVFLGLVKTPIAISGTTMSWVEWYGGDGEGKDQWIRMTKRIVPRPEVSPFAVDIVPDFPQHKTWSRVGIVECRGDEMKLCVNFPQGPRPLRFEHAEDGREHVVLRRVISKEPPVSQ